MVLHLPIVRATTGRVSLLLRSANVYCVRLRQRTGRGHHGSRDKASRRGVVFLFNPFSRILVRLRSRLPRLPSLMNQALS